ncbi:MAG: type II secretion system F family protein [Dehalococcoidia bacterium]|nr:type II secretion system F family protein [Dehalococcoidia bacterium]
MLYKYVAFAPSGEQVNGSVDADSEEIAERTLWDWHYKVVLIQRVKPRPTLDQLIPSLFGVKPREVINFSRHLATLVESGIALLPGIELLQGQSKGPFARVLGDIARDLKNGSPFSTAIAQHRTIFPPIYNRLMEVGERTGSLETVLRQVATHMEKEQAIVKRVRGAMAYPAFMVVLAVVVVGILVTTALPPLVSLFDEFDTGLPLPTRILIGVSTFATAYKTHMLVVAVMVVAVAAWYVRQPSGRRQLDYLFVRLPLIGAINIQSNVSRFSRTMAMLLRAGLPLSDIMELVLQTTQNQIIRDELSDVREELMRGEGLAKPFARSRLFPSMLSQVVSVGEETGALDTNLDTLAEFYAAEVDERVGALTSMVQPVMTLGIGLVVAFIAISIIMPMYSIMGHIQ